MDQYHPQKAELGEAKSYIDRARRSDPESETTMKQMNGRARRALNHLYLILDAGERGYAMAAANVNNRALKMLFRTYARQRADFKAELQGQTPGLRIPIYSLVGFLAMIHRGRISIFAALTIGEQNGERVVMKEVLVGEAATLRAYERALSSGLPAGLAELVRKQSQAVQETVEQVELMRGKHGKQVVMRLYDSDGDARRAEKMLQQAHMGSSPMDTLAVENETEPYDDGMRGTMFETILSGAAGGALWGAVSGALAGLGVLHLPTLGLAQAALAIQEMAWAETALGAILAGSFVGAVLGTFIG